MQRVLACLFLGGCAFFGGGVAVTMAPLLQLPAAVANPSDTDRSAIGRTDALRLGDRFEEVARRVSSAVVYVEVVKPATASTSVNGRTRSEESGSGVIIRTEDGHGHLVLTNNHVVAQARPDQITINLADSRIVRPQRVWADPESDVAVLKLDGIENLTSIPLGDSDWKPPSNGRWSETPSISRASGWRRAPKGRLFCKVSPAVKAPRHSPTPAACSVNTTS